MNAFSAKGCGNKRKFGSKFESIASSYLQTKNLTLVGRNFYSKYGEIDLIFYDNNVDELVFTEVRFRESMNDAAESISISKQKKMLKAAKIYLQEHADQEINARFDCVLIDASGKINWIKNVIQDY